MQSGVVFSSSCWLWTSFSLSFSSLVSSIVYVCSWDPQRLAAVASYDFFVSSSAESDYFTINAVYCCLNLLNDILGLIVTARSCLCGLSLFLATELIMTIFSTVAAFSPVVLLHLLVLLLVIQHRMSVSRVSLSSHSPSLLTFKQATMFRSPSQTV